MRWFISSFALVTLGFGMGSGVWAQERDETSGTTMTESSEVSRGYLQEEVVAFKPTVGMIQYSQGLAAADNAERFLVGLSMDYNITNMVSENLNNFYIGPSLGVLYSHLGDPSSNFFGTNPNSSSQIGSSGANLLVIPTDLKVGYNIGKAMRLSAHGGANVIYRSVANSMNLNNTISTASAWNYYPNAGADLELGFGKSIALSLRPDWTFAPNDTFMMATLGLGITLG